MNKKIMVFGVLGLFTMGLVVAGLITYYGQATQTINVESPVEFIGDATSSVDGLYAGTVLVGNKLKMRNNANFEVLMQISDDSDSHANRGIETSYFGNLELTKKTVDFNSNNWVVLEGAEDKVQIEYTVVGDEFNAEVVEADVEAGYVLIYYADALDRFVNPEEAILVEGNSFPYLPYNVDMNSEFADEYNYCDTGEYVTCHGAKIWYVPSDAINVDGTLQWNKASEFYFESSLIQYNTEGQITVYPDETLDFTPKFDVSLLFKGTADITTSVAPVIVA